MTIVVLVGVLVTGMVIRVQTVALIVIMELPTLLVMPVLAQVAHSILPQVIVQFVTQLRVERMVRQTQRVHHATVIQISPPHQMENVIYAFLDFVTEEVHQQAHQLVIHVPVTTQP